MPDPVEVAEDNFVAAARLFAELTPGATLDDGHGVLHMHSGAQLATFNPTLVLDYPFDGERLIRESAAFHASHASPAWVVAVREPDAGQFASVAAANGFTLAEEQPFMVLDEIPDAELPAELTVRRATDLDDVRLHFDLVSRAFGMPIEAIEVIITDALVDDRVPIFLGEIDGEAATTSMLVVSDAAGTRTAGVYDVATLPSHRGRGLGTAMTAHAAAVGRHEHGCALATLQSSPMGFPVYEAMGYRIVTRWQMWTPPP